MGLTDEEKRQIEMYKRLGIELKQPTVEGWFFGIADLMCPMYYDYDEDYSRDLLELLPHNLKQKGIL